MNSVRLVLSLAASFKWEVHQMDVKFAFLHGDLHEEIYMEQPTGFIQTDSSLVCHLKKSLYGLKQAPRAWYAKMDSFLLESGFSRCHSDNTVYTKKEGKSLIILVLYVDDLILTGSDCNLINHVKSSLKKKFEMTDLGHLHYFLGLQVLQSKEGIFLSQSKYACDLLRFFHMEDCKPSPSPVQSGVKLSVSCTSPEVDATLYRQLVGKLLYLTHTRPDLSVAIGLVALFMQTPRESHWKAAKRILRYVRGTVQFGIHYSAGPITWDCKKQVAISLSSAEAEYRGAVEASKEALWLHQILTEFGFQQQHPTTHCVIIKVPFNFAKIQFSISAANTLNYTCTSSESSFMTMFLKCNIVQQMIKLQTSSQRLSQRRSSLNFDLWLEFRKLSLRGDRL
eukprot:PITA_31679